MDTRNARFLTSEGSNFLWWIFEQAGHLSGLAVDDGRGYEDETAIGVELLVNFPGTDAPPLGKEDVPGELVELFDLEETLADALPEL